jgi:two-component system phosphate regulon response regulator PhoB
MLGTASPTPTRVLLVDDDPSLTSLQCYSLEAAGYQVQIASNGERALSMFTEQAPDLVLLDLVLPDISGFEVCRRIRASASVRQPAIIIVSAKTQETDRVEGFEVGADDFVAKPFSANELMLRIQARLHTRPQGEAAAVVRPEPKQPTSERLVLGPLTIDRTSHRVFLSDKEIRLSVQEMRLLKYLASEPGKLHTRRNLLTSVWGYHPKATSRTLDTHIKRLRDKFGPLSTMLQTVHGLGYRLTLPAHDTRVPSSSGTTARRR